MKVNPWEIEAEKKKEFIECAGNIMPESIVNWLFRIGYFIDTSRSMLWWTI